MLLLVLFNCLNFPVLPQVRPDMRRKIFRIDAAGFHRPVAAAVTEMTVSKQWRRVRYFPVLLERCSLVNAMQHCRLSICHTLVLWLNESSWDHTVFMLVFGVVRFIWKFGQNHPEWGHQIVMGYGKVPLSFNIIRLMSLLEKLIITVGNVCSTLFPVTAGPSLFFMYWSCMLMS